MHRNVSGELCSVSTIPAVEALYKGLPDSQKEDISEKDPDEGGAIEVGPAAVIAEAKMYKV